MTVSARAFMATSSLMVAFLTGCKMTDLSAWEHHNVAIDIYSVSFALPPNQSGDLPGKSVPLRSVSINKNAAQEEFQQIFDGLWDFRRSAFYAVEGQMEFDLAVVKLRKPVRADSSKLSEYAEQILADRVARIDELNIEQLRNDMPRYPVPDKSQLSYQIHNGCRALFEKTSSKALLIVPITDEFYVQARTSFSIPKGREQYEAIARQLTDQILNSIQVSIPRIGTNPLACDFDD